MKSIYFALLLCVAMLGMSIADAQFFEPKSVVVWEVLDDNSNVAITEQSKLLVRTEVTNALVRSDEYKVYDYDIERIVNYAKSRNCSTNYDDLANAVGELYRNIDYVIFTKIYILQSSDYVDRHQIAIVVDVFDRGSEDVVRSASAKTLSGHSYIRSACAQLLTTLLGEDTKRY